jgi:hypothetical protein
MGLFGDKKGSSSVYDARGTAARKMAIESFKNIANTVVGGDAVMGPSPDPEVEAIERLLSNATTPVAIAEVAEQLNWDSGRAAEALTRGGDNDRLIFVKSGGRTFVGLPAEPMT